MSEEQNKDAAAEQVLTGLQSLLRGVTLYDANNATIARIIGQLLDAVNAFRGPEGTNLKLQVLADEVFANGRLLKLDPIMYDRATILAEGIAPWKIGEFGFGEGLTREHLVSFAADMAESVRGTVMTIKPAYGPLTLAEARGSSIASFRFEPDRLAVWLFTSLLDLTEKLYAEHAEGKSPSLLSVKRTLQLVIDNMRTHGAIYQLLSTVQAPDRAPSLAARRVVTTVNLIGFGIYLDLPLSDLMTLALAGLVGGLSLSPDPDKAVQVLFAFPGMGDAAMGLTLLLHDARSARRTGKAALPGCVLGMVEEYVNGTMANDKRPAVSPHMVLRTLHSDRIAWVPTELAHAFIDWKGPYPLGSLVTLDPGGVAVVVGQKSGAKARPVVAPVARDGGLGEPVDLAAKPNVKITGAPNPTDSGVRLSLHAPRG